jgi:hypothetical protein
MLYKSYGIWPSFVFEFSPFPIVLRESLDDDCSLSHGAKAIFLERIFASFGLRHDDKEINNLRQQLKALLCHNTDLKGKIYSHHPILHHLLT